MVCLQLIAQLGRAVALQGQACIRLLALGQSLQDLQAHCGPEARAVIQGHDGFSNPHGWLRSAVMCSVLLLRSLHCDITWQAVEPAWVWHRRSDPEPEQAVPLSWHLGKECINACMASCCAEPCRASHMLCSTADDGPDFSLLDHACAGSVGESGTAARQQVLVIDDLTMLVQAASSSHVVRHIERPAQATSLRARRALGCALHFETFMHPAARCQLKLQTCGAAATCCVASVALHQHLHAGSILCTTMSPSGLQVCSWLYNLQQGGLHSILAGIGKVRWQQGLSGLRQPGQLSQSSS